MPHIFFNGLFFAFMAFGLLKIVVELVGAGLYDLKQVRQHKQRDALPANMPLVSVIIPARNCQATIRDCLDSIVKNSHKNVEIIVVNRASTDETRQIIAGFIASHKHRTIRLLNKRQDTGREAGIISGYNRWSKGGLIMTLDGDCLLDQQAIMKAAAHFEPGGISALTPNIRILARPTISGLAQRFTYLMRSRTMKLVAATEGTAMMYRRDIFKKRKGSVKSRPRYASDVLVYAEPLPLGRALLIPSQGNPWLSKSRPALYLLELVLLGYLLYVAIALRQPMLLGISWLLFSVLLAIAVASDEQGRISRKIPLLLLTPMISGVFGFLVCARAITVLPA